MKNSIIKRILFAALIYVLATGVSVGQTVHYKVVYNTTTCLYEARAVVASGSIGGTAPNSIPFPSVFTIAVPAAYGDAQFSNVTSYNPVGKQWTEGQGLRAPNAAPSFDYHPFSMLGGGAANVYPATATGGEILLFTFSLSGDQCGAGVRPYINGGTPAGDPTSVQYLAAGDPGISINNSFKIFPNKDLYTGNDASQTTRTGPSITGGAGSCNGTALVTNANITPSACASSLMYSWTGPGGYTASTQNISLSSPANPSGTYSLTATDNLGCKTTQNYSLDPSMCTPVSISGTVHNDINGGTINGNGINNPGGQQLYANLVNPVTGLIAGSVPVNSDGTYTLTNANGVQPNTNYNIVLSTTQGQPGTTTGATPSIPSGWINTAEGNGGTTGDGTPNGILPVSVGTTSITSQDFGIEQPPTAGNGSNTAINPGGGIQVPVPANTFTNITPGSDPAPGCVTGVRILSLPAGANSIVINGTTYTAANFPAAGVVAATDCSGNPTVPISIDPTAIGVTTVTIPFKAIDAAGKESTNTGTAIVNFPDDIDDDNDGITDLNESGGYDPLADCDGDGIVNYLDVNPGCPTPAGNDPWGQPYKPLIFSDCNGDGINDFFDFDRDGIINELDLDSDNDGILDVQEARPGGAAFTLVSHGQITGTDADGNGLLSSADNGNSNPVLNGIAAQDLDRDGIPNFLDLDSDGDGMTDITEALGEYDANGVADGADTDGDGVKAEGFGDNSANIADDINGKGAKGLTLLDSDGDGKPDAYDIDSDNDGISDNVEAQPTCSMKLPQDADCNGNGVDNSYDITSCSSCLKTSGGITPYDKDGDGTPDYLDLDTDNDGKPDINEGSGLTGNFVTNFADSDGDGLIDQFDSFDIKAATGNFTNNVGHNQMGNNGSFDGPVPSGSTAQLPQTENGSCPTVDRDWRNISILPLNIVRFTGSLNNGQAQLKWNVVNEQDVKDYIVERSIDGVNFAAIGDRLSQNANAATYSYSDEVAFLNASIIYYRIKQVNKNGLSFYTNVVAINLPVMVQNDLKIYPNPADTYINLTFSSAAPQSGDVSIYTIAGKKIINSKYEIKKGSNTLKISDLRKLAEGSYLVQVVTGTETLTGRFIK